MRKNFCKSEEFLLAKYTLSLEEKISLMGGNVRLQDMLNDLRDSDDQKHYNYYPYPAGGIAGQNIPPMLFCDGPRV